MCSRSSRACATCSASIATAASEVALSVGDGVVLDAALTLPDGEDIGSIAPEYERALLEWLEARALR